MSSTTNILVCDDDPQFAATTVAEIQRRLTVQGQCPLGSCNIQALSNLSQLRQISTDTVAAQYWHVIFCDLGWGDLTLEGIQILHDIQLHNPQIQTVLYTAQDANTFVDQALRWKLHFVDQVLKVDQRRFHQRLFEIVFQLLEERTVKAAGDIDFSGLHLLSGSARHVFVEQSVTMLHRLQQLLLQAISAEESPGVSAEVLFTPDEISVKLKQCARLQRQQKYVALIEAVQNFPRLGPHDLLPLAKPAYIEFVRERYGGFPQMAEARKLDLNHIYRVNRRFKHTRFVVFKFATIEEIVGIYEPEARIAQIRQLLCPIRVIQKVVSGTH